MQGKGCRVCLGGTICSIPCHASWFASVYLEGTVEFSRSAWKKRFNSTVSFKSTETKQLARQGIEQILPRKQTRRPLTCLTVCFNPPSMAYPKGCRYSSRALTKMLVQRFIWMKFLTCNLTKVLERKNSTSLTENNDTWCKNGFFMTFFSFSSQNVSVKSRSKYTAFVSGALWWPWHSKIWIDTKSYFYFPPIKQLPSNSIFST